MITNKNNNNSNKIIIKNNYQNIRCLNNGDFSSLLLYFIYFYIL